jgi:hypothetical protein
MGLGDAGARGRTPGLVGEADTREATQRNHSHDRHGCPSAYAHLSPPIARENDTECRLTARPLVALERAPPFWAERPAVGSPIRRDFVSVHDR